MAILTPEKFENLNRDIEDTGKAINIIGIITPRYGEPFKSLPLVSKEAENRGGFISAPNLAALQTIMPSYNWQLARDDSTGNEYRWNPAATPTPQWEPTGRNYLKEAVDYSNQFSALTKNATVFYPFNSTKRNNVSASSVSASHEAYLKSYILNITVNGADPNKYYRIQQISTPTNPTVPNRWVFEVLNRTNFDSSETVEKTIPVVFPIVKNMGIQTFNVVDGDVTIIVTVDTSKVPTSDFYSVASTDSSYTYIIDPSRYIFSAFKKSDAVSYVDSFSTLTKNSTVLFPFSTLKRNNVNESTVGSHDNILRNFILDVRVMNADPNKYYRLQQMSSPDQATNPNRWIFEELSRSNFDTTETKGKAITAVFPIVKNTGIKNFVVKEGDLSISVTVDTNKTPSNNFYSVASTDNSYTYIIDPSLYSYAAVGSSDLAVINKRIDGFIKPMQLQNLLKDLRNPIQSVQINLIGDSITYGYGATDNGAGPTPPHGPATTKTWANSVRDYLGTAFCTSERFDDTILETGEAYYTSDGTSVLSAELSNFTFKNSATGKEFTIAEMQALVGILPTSPVGTYIDLRSPSLTSVIAPTDMEFLFNGNGFTINHARLSHGSATESIIDVFVNDVLHSSFNVYSATPDFLGKHEVSDLVDGPKKIRISNRLTNTLIYARLLSITATRKISVINNGVSGSNTGSWLTGNWIPDRISNKDNYVIVMLGTNDRHTTQKIGTFKNNYVQLLDRISVKNPKAQIIVMSPPAVTQSEDPSTGRLFRIADLNYALSQIAQLKSVSFISLFEATSKLKAQGTLFLADQLHPNDYGYGVIAEYIINQILSA
ncbi:SGNH/GDSL hydrolase family protein [Acinetobacter baumannii]|uniref:SGNH/GDSL hydrolase family protein n=1 Tax=Acinetobacter baumannii TaxID=470 RepID=UPI000DED0DAB|nr:GDSL-type esterase/lipase family protein [Acinetobacter baumannii]MBF6721618.1 SGNH/GDSL hydrolase family protein [Acinetobacter baumannii]MBF6799246.1 SGNH/GDSL hydrolase family protein [Acinetobacter baumannii]MBF6951863.1 SGNH/GDSL hydrolase family protein [Acinetobacter baumannii]MBF6967423.1 SGNH/GDSL hydrolase family protein [Acinetobacter baumannii]MBF8382719.1 SGNH/GDSL hydrolase family protein [Acinetobacter baumannii]